jgi:hypothetical protein
MADESAIHTASHLLAGGRRGRKPDKLFELFLADVAATRQSAANRTEAFQMASFSRKPLRRAKRFHLFDDEHFDWFVAGHEFERGSRQWFIVHVRHA